MASLESELSNIFNEIHLISILEQYYNNKVFCRKNKTLCELNLDTSNIKKVVKMINAVSIIRDKYIIFKHGLFCILFNTLTYEIMKFEYDINNALSYKNDIILVLHKSVETINKVDLSNIPFEHIESDYISVKLINDTLLIYGKNYRYQLDVIIFYNMLTSKYVELNEKYVLGISENIVVLKDDNFVYSLDTNTYELIKLDKILDPTIIISNHNLITWHDDYFIYVYVNDVNAIKTINPLIMPAFTKICECKYNRKKTMMINFEDIIKTRALYDIHTNELITIEINEIVENMINVESGDMFIIFNNEMLILIDPNTKTYKIFDNSQYNNFSLIDNKLITREVNGKKNKYISTDINTRKVLKYNINEMFINWHYF